MNLIKQYEERLCSKEEAVSIIEPEEDIITPILAGEPYALMKQLENHRQLRGNRLIQMFSTRDVIQVEPNKLQIMSTFLGASERKAFQEGKIDILPNHFSDTPNLMKQFTKDQVVMVVVSPMDENGYFSMGTNCDYVATMIPYAKKIILEVNENMPRTFGENQIHISQVSALVENNDTIPEAPTPRQSEKDKIIGEYVTQLINDGDTIQIGYGAIPNAIIDQLASHRNLTIHTEMIPEKIIDLFESGAVTNENNIFKRGAMTATFAYGSRRLYDFLHENEDVYMLPVNQTNAIEKLIAFKNLVTINAAVEVDFLGQVNSEMIGNTYWSSSGGQADFQIASRLVEGGRGILCMHSTVKRDTISKIVPTLNSGTPVTTSKNDVDYIVTEYGVARLRGKTIRERTKELIRIAHPKFREELEFQAKKMGYLL